MEQSKVNEIIMVIKDKIPEDKLIYVKGLLEKADDSKYEMVMMQNYKSSTTTLLCSIFLGGLGVDRFYIGDTGLGVAKLLLGWLTFGIWSLIDIFLCFKKTKEKNLNKVILGL